MIEPFILDTDLFSDFAAGNPRLATAILSRPARRIGIAVITVEESLTGWYSCLRSAKRPEMVARAYWRLAETVRFLNQFEIVDFDEAAIDRYETLKAARLNIGAMDLKIAAIALEHNCTVVTRNLRDFGRVPGLVVADWSA